MASIDNKVVSITFDNAAFEKNVAQTMKTLAALKTSLNFTGATAGLEDISAAAGRFSLAGIGSAVDSINSKFSAMGAIAFSVINNITTRAIDMGTQLAKQFTIDPVQAGFQEFELKMGSIQTIMAGSGESLEVVNQKLADLNAYSDRTIYSFKDMTSNIGKFTNAGVSLDQSVASIQGIANVAALSGANAEEASRAMYNFAQALSSGSVKLMDWKSIELANMATVEFKTELLESAVAAGTLNKSADGLYTTLEGTPVSATKGFNESLEQQWLTTQALNDTLARYSDETTDIGARATAAAQDVKTFSQMMDTLKESAGSGWAQTSEIIFGDFEEGKKLWTGVNNVLGGMISSAAEARNAVLTSWDGLGGRDLLINSISMAFTNLGAILKPIKEAFREVFPAKTGKDLFDFTVTLSKLAMALKPTEKTVENLKSTFLGIFSIFRIGMEVVKGVASVFVGLFKAFGGGAGGGALSFLAVLGDAINEVRLALVEEGGIAKFFDKITASLVALVSKVNLGPTIDLIKSLVNVVREFVGGLDFGPAIDKLIELRDTVVSFFRGLDFSGPLSAITDFRDAIFGLFERDISVPKQVGESFSALGGVFKSLGGFIQDILDGIGGFGKSLGKAGSATGQFVGKVQDELANLSKEIKNSFSTGNFDNTIKALQVGLFGGLLVLIRKFLKDGLKIDFGQLGVFDELKNSLQAVTGGLTAMQNNIKADTLMKIAIALGVLTLSMLALSLVDGEDLAKALTAMTVGFAQLAGVMKVLDTMSNGPMAAAKLVLLSVGLTILAGAMFLLGLSAKLMASMGWEEMGRGLLGVTALLVLMSKAVEPLSKNSSGMISAGIGIGFLAAGLLVLAFALRMMATMSWEEMAQGLVGTAVGLEVISRAMERIKPDGVVKSALAVGIMGASLMVLVGAIKLMASLGLMETAQGLGGIAAGLGLLVLVFNKIDNDKVLAVGAAMLLTSIGMIFMAKAVKEMSTIPFPQMIKGLIGFSAVLIILALAMKASKASLGGAVALFVVAQALGKLAEVLEFVGRLPFGVIAQGILVMTGVIIGLAVVANIISPLIPLFAGMGAAFALVGAGAALFGAGVYLVARGIQILASDGEEGVKTFLGTLDDMIAALPKIATALGKAALEFVSSFLSGFGDLIPMVLGLLGKLIDGISELYPKIVEAGIGLIVALLDGIQVVYPKLVETGLAMLTALLTGIRDNIGNITTTAIQIVTEFINGMAAGIPDYVRAMVNLFTTILETMVYELGFLMTTLAPGLGMSFMDGFLTGLSETVGKVQEFFTGWIADVIDWVKSGFGIFSPSKVMDEIGVNVILGFLKGLLDTIGQVSSFFTNLAGDVLRWIGNTVVWLVSKGADIISGLKQGIDNTIAIISTFMTGLKDKVLTWIGSALSWLRDKGKDVIDGFKDGMEIAWAYVSGWVIGIPGRVKGFFSDALNMLYDAGKKIFQGLWNGMKDVWDDVTGWMSNLNPANWKGPPARDEVMLLEAGRLIFGGLWKGMSEVWDDTTVWLGKVNPAEHLDTNNIKSGLRDAMSVIPDIISDIDDFNPTIRPVLDLTGVQKDAKSLNGILAASAVGGYNQAALIAAASKSGFGEKSSGGTEIKFEQTINAPTALSTNDIYRQTRSLIAITKEEVKIP